MTVTVTSFGRRSACRTGRHEEKSHDQNHRLSATDFSSRWYNSQTERSHSLVPM